MKQHSDSKEFSRFIEVDKIGHGGASRSISATAEERRALADRFDLQEIAELSANLNLARTRGGAVRLDGRIHAEIVQTCVVSLQPVPAVIDDPIAMSFAEAAGGDAGEGSAEIDLLYDVDDAAEPILNGRIDLGEAVAQQLALVLDPYPRAPGAEIPPAYAADLADVDAASQAAEPTPEGVPDVNPFSILGKLKG